MLTRLFNWFSRSGDANQTDDGGATALAEPPDGCENFGLDREPEPQADAIPDGWWTVDPDEAVIDLQQAWGSNEHIDSDLFDHLARVVADPDLELPRIPRVAQQALAMIRAPDLELRDLARVVSRDPALATNLLRVANSAMFRGISEIKSLEPALARLGRKNIESVLLARSARELAITTDGARRGLGHELWQRAVACGVILGHLGPRFNRSEQDAFLVGLLHDIGTFAILRVVHDYQRLHSRRVSRAVFDRLSREWHGHLGLRLADAWNLPDPLPEIIGQHHELPDDHDPLRIYRLLVQTSDAACSLLGYGRYVPYDFFRLACVRGLGLSPNGPTGRLLEPIPDLVRDRLATL